MTASPESSSSESSRSLRWWGLFSGPVLALLVYLVLPSTYRDHAGSLVPFTGAGRATLAMMVWMAAWWLTEAIDIPATALLPLVCFPLLGIADMKTVAAPYAHPLIYLFLGGFLIARAMQYWGLGERIALRALLLVGSKPSRMIAGFMATTAVLSMFVSNTATTAMMVPIGISVIRLVQPDPGRETAAWAGNFGIGLMLGIAYAASVGGIATIIGTPPNALLVGFLSESIAEPYRMDIGFAGWLRFGLPLTLVFLPIIWFLLTRVLYPVKIRSIPGGRELMAGKLRELGPVGRGERIVLTVFLCTAALWMVRPLLAGIPVLGRFSDAGIAMAGAMTLFFLPVDAGRRIFALNWRIARKIPWGVLVLFGGGLSLAHAVESNGVADFLGSLVGSLPKLPDLVLILAVTGLVVLLTELTSNTATTATLLPVLAGLAPGLGIHPYLLLFPTALAASCAFMMPVATPPNAIVFSSGYVTLPQMVRAGSWLIVIGTLLITFFTRFLFPIP